jgi:ketosteroid isomerase-like protein
LAVIAAQIRHESQILHAKRLGGHRGWKRAAQQACHVWNIRDGRITSFQQYMDTAQLQDVEGVC